ncbi:MAG TPA: ribonuclease HI [Dokdonella sp.]|uniref:ribonuclease HI n=1 Tax=Dokdonella sp. TaxID=2291710 RepID=UPI0025BBCFB2|nr:ribonuclease HI [Dokdonella sp.]MBX3692766.1 ribonuclease HI [Dokdonella sp.]MCW5568822.1 ribonuclease HI [Dokdonella sp.]HNR91068.1 ribonuclease HI [Dokdonella sp.]
MSEVEVITDGACLGNPGPGGWAVLLRHGTTERELCGAEAHTTNNRMELMAAIAGLEALRRPCSVKLTTDSQYLMRGVEEWMPRWIAKGWRTAGGDPVKNRDLWERLAAALGPHRVRWAWVRGHAGHADNERVDRLARTAAERVRDEGQT